MQKDMIMKEAEEQMKWAFCWRLNSRIENLSFGTKAIEKEEKKVKAPLPTLRLKSKSKAEKKKKAPALSLFSYGDENWLVCLGNRKDRIIKL